VIAARTPSKGSRCASGYGATTRATSSSWVALADNLLIARAAYDAAVKAMRPGANLVLRHDAQIVVKARD
jgi:hypothetical protein